jgi:hypothetical protein
MFCWSGLTTQELEHLQVSHANAVKQLEAQLADNRQEIARLQDEVHTSYLHCLILQLSHASTIRKAQLSELGLLREEVSTQYTGVPSDACRKSSLLRQSLIKVSSS